MSSYYLARSLGNEAYIPRCKTGLSGEINQRYPNRDHLSDGSVGDTSHSARASDHNPDRNDGGIIRAIDVDNNGREGEVTDVVRDVLRAVIGDPRAYYVIWNWGICSATYGWTWRRYTGSNGHTKHVHVSVLDGPGENNAALWLPAQVPPFKLQPLRVSLKGVRKEFLAAVEGREVSVNNGVGRIQHVLVHTQGAELKVDGIAGNKTVQAMAAYERKRGGLGRPGVPDRVSLAYLSNKGKRFGLVA